MHCTLSDILANPIKAIALVIKGITMFVRYRMDAPVSLDVANSLTPSPEDMIYSYMRNTRVRGL